MATASKRFAIDPNNTSARTVEIVPYRESFSEGLRDLVLPIQREGFGLPITYQDQPDLHGIDAFYRNGTGEFWVAPDEAEGLNRSGCQND